MHRDIDLILGGKPVGSRLHIAHGQFAELRRIEKEHDVLPRLHHHIHQTLLRSVVCRTVFETFVDRNRLLSGEIILLQG